MVTTKKGAKIEKIGLDKSDMTMVFRGAFGDKIIENPLMSSVAKAVGEVIDQDDKMLLSSSWVLQEKEVSKL